MASNADYVSFKDGKFIVEKVINGQKQDFGGFDTLNDALNRVRYLEANNWQSNDNTKTLEKIKYEDFISYNNGKFVVSGGDFEAKTFDKFEDAFEYATHIFSNNDEKATSKENICPFCGDILVKKQYSNIDLVSCKNFPNCHFICSAEVFNKLYDSSTNSLEDEVNTLKNKIGILSSDVNNLKSLLSEISSILNKNI